MDSYELVILISGGILMWSVDLQMLVTSVS